MRKGLHSTLVPVLGGQPFPAKITCVLFAILLLTFAKASASVGTLASTITIEASNEKLSTILQKIEENTNYHFIYESSNADCLVSIEAEDASLDAVLAEVLAGQNLTYTLAEGNKIVILRNDSPENSAQTEKIITVTGVVRDETGALPGVTVVVTGTTNGTITDIDGKYSLPGVPANGTITYSFIGMETQTIPVENRTSINVILSAGNVALEEVVAVGYGTQTKGSLTAAVAQVSAKEIAELPVSNLSQSLQGVIPGLNINNVSSRPGEAADLSIRQSFSLSKDGGNSVPLVIIDDVMQLDANTGLPTLEQFNMLDPSEIENITVLKDASAAIYGARAAQGAIIVTTKRGKKGQAKISYSGQVTYNDAVSHGKVLSGEQYGNYWNTLIEMDPNGDPTINDLYSINEIYDMSQLNYDWLDEAWSSSLTQRHSLGVSGGSENATYYAGLSVFDQGANLGSQDYQRYNFRSNVAVKVAEGLKLTANLSANKGELERSYTKSSANINNGYATGTRSDYAVLLHMPTHIPWQVEYQGADYFFSPLLGTTTPTVGSTIDSRKSMAGWNYFANEASGSESIEESMSYAANFGLEYNVPFLKGLSVKGTYSIQQSYTEGDQVALPLELLYQENTNVAHNHLYNPNADFGIGVNRGGGDLEILYDSNYNKRTQYNFYVNYSGQFGEHTISAMGAIERSKGYRSSQRQIYSNPDDPYLGGSSTAGDIQDGSYIMRYQNASMSYIGRVNYSYKNRYLASFLIRSDASTKFAPENYWGTFPSLSLGWVISDENWFENALPWVNYFKFRYSFGITGKDNIRPWLWLQQYDYTNDGGLGFGEDGGNRTEGLKPGKTPNPDVKWDKTFKNNFGIDGSVLRDRLSFGFDFYYDMARDMLTVMSAQIGSPITTGGAFTEQNYSSINAWGYEAQFNWRDKITEDLQYSVGINFGRGYNKVVKYFESNYRYPADVSMQEGESTIRPMYGYKVWTGTSGGDGILRTQEDIDNYWAYLSANAAAAGSEGAYYFGTTDISQMQTGNLAYQDRYGKPNEDGSMTQADGRIGEDGSQDFYELEKANSRRGFVTNLGITYKSFNFKTQISTSWGGIRYIDRVQAYRNEFFWNPEAFWADMYNPAAPMVGRYPISTENGNLTESDFWTVGTFRCFVRNMSLSYNLPKNWMNSIGIDRAAFTLTGYNLWDFYNPFPKKYRNMYDSSTAGYPTLRSWSLGVNVSF